MMRESGISRCLVAAHIAQRLLLEKRIGEPTARAKERALSGSPGSHHKRKQLGLLIRANSRLRQLIGEPGVAFIEHATGSIQRILPHVEVSNWSEGNWQASDSVWTSSRRTHIRMTLAIGENGANARSLSAKISRRRLPGVGGAAARSLDLREYDICKRIALRISEVLRRTTPLVNAPSLEAIAAAFDEYVIAFHIADHHGLHLSVSKVFDALHTLSEQSYENKALTFGCILDPTKRGGANQVRFPLDFVRSKKYKALSDGFRTAYHISRDGKVLSFLDLEDSREPSVTEKHYYPEWAEPIARASRSGKCGIALSRQGDILLFDEGTLRFTYRYGRWQYWNHSHLVNLVRDRARAQKVKPAVTGRVVGAIYRAALDVSFRRSGGLFVVLHNRRKLGDVVREGDVIGNANRRDVDLEFDALLNKQRIQSLSRAVVVELASLDGAIVCENSGRILAYAAVLQPKRRGRLLGSEGSRTKAAIGASNYGVAVKISSDGEIVVYHGGDEFMGIR